MGHLIQFETNHPSEGPSPPAAPLAHAGEAAAPLANSKPRPLTKVIILNLNVLTDTPPTRQDFALVKPPYGV